MTDQMGSGNQLSDAQKLASIEAQRKIHTDALANIRQLSEEERAANKEHYETRVREITTALERLVEQEAAIHAKSEPLPASRAVVLRPPEIFVDARQKFSALSQLMVRIGQAMGKAGNEDIPPTELEAALKNRNVSPDEAQRLAKRFVFARVLVGVNNNLFNQDSVPSSGKDYGAMSAEFDGYANDMQELITLLARPIADDQQKQRPPGAPRQGRQGRRSRGGGRNGGGPPTPGGEDVGGGQGAPRAQRQGPTQRPPEDPLQPPNEQTEPSEPVLANAPYARRIRSVVFDYSGPQGIRLSINAQLNARVRKEVSRQRVLDAQTLLQFEFAKAQRENNLERADKASAALAIIGEELRAVDSVAAEVTRKVNERNHERAEEYIAEARRITPPEIFSTLRGLRTSDGTTPSWSDADMRHLEIAIGKQGSYRNEWWKPHKQRKLSSAELAALQRAQRDYGHIQKAAERAAREAANIRARQDAAQRARERRRQTLITTGEGRMNDTEKAALAAAVGRVVGGREFTQEDLLEFYAKRGGWTGEIAPKLRHRLSTTPDDRMFYLRIREILKPVWDEEERQWRQKTLNELKDNAKWLGQKIPGLKAIIGKEVVEASREATMELGKQRLSPSAWRALDAGRRTEDMSPDEQLYLYIMGRKESRGIPIGNDERDAFQRVTSRIPTS